MRRLLMVAVALVAAGCGAPVSGSAAPSTVADSKRVDMCTILTDQELSQLGIKLDTREPVDRPGSVGCSWRGTPFALTLERDTETVAAYKARQPGPALITFTENTVNGRAGVRFGVERDGTDCEQLIDGGSVSLVVSVAPALSANGPKVDSCAEALRIAQMIEPRLPKTSS
ncbi:MAG: DUF3558 domain-containing protein [Pseudonocardiaceae bacterium]